MPTPEQNARPYQFRLRTLFVLTFVVSIYAAIMAPFLRTASLKQLLGIGLFWMAALAAYFLMGENLNAAERRNQGAHRGASLLRFPTPWRRTKAAFIFAPCVFSTAIVHFISYTIGMTERFHPGGVPMQLLLSATMGVSAGQMAQMGLYAARRRWSVEFFEGGVFTRGGYSPWSDLRGWVVKESQPGRLTLRLKLDRVTLRLDEQQMRQARQILEQYLPGKNRDITPSSPAHK